MRRKLNKPIPMRHLGGPRYTDAEFRQKMEERKAARAADTATMVSLKRGRRMV